MATLYEFAGTAPRPPGSDAPNAGVMGATAPHPTVIALPLAPCSADGTPAWSLARLGENRFRLTLAAPGLSDGDIAVQIRGGLLHIDGHRDRHSAEKNSTGPGAAPGIDCAFLLLEPLHLVDYGLLDGRLFVDLQRDHAIPCRADPPPRMRQAAALALAA